MNKTGFLLIDKQPDWTSFDVCAVMKRTFDQKKVGHTGTLDPFATGLLVIAMGKATKLIPFLEKAEKTYEATFILGKTTPTHDPESEITDNKVTKFPDLAEIEAKSAKYRGEIMQTPPQFSAIKQKGKKAYELARKGQKVDIPPRETEVFSLDIVEYNAPELKLSMRVKAGFYVRALARDLGEDLGIGAYCSALRRTKVGDLDIKDATMTDCPDLPIDPKYIVNLPQVELPANRLPDYKNGRAVPMKHQSGTYLVTMGGKTIGLGFVEFHLLHPRVSF